MRRAPVSFTSRMNDSVDVVLRHRILRLQIAVRHEERRTEVKGRSELTNGRTNTRYVCNFLSLFPSML